MTRLPNLPAWVDGLRARGIVVELSARGRPRYIVPPGVKFTEYEREVARGQSDYIAAMLGGDVESMPAQGFHECETPVVAPEPPAPEPAEPEPAEVDEHDVDAESAPVASPRDGVLWGGGQLKRPERTGEPTREDFLLGDAVVQKQVDGLYRLVWASHDAEMSAGLRRSFHGGRR